MDEGKKGGGLRRLLLKANLQVEASHRSSHVSLHLHWISRFYPILSSAVFWVLTDALDSHPQRDKKMFPKRLFI